MRQVSVMLSVIAIILLVIFAHGNQTVAGYLSQNIHKGQSVFVQDEETAFVNDEYTLVLHTGFSYSDSFMIRDIVEVNGTEYVYLAHSVSGVFDEPDYRFGNITGGHFDLEENITFDVWDFIYIGSFVDEENNAVYVYEYQNITVAVSTNSFVIVEDAGRNVLLQQTDGEIQVNEIDEPFSIGVEHVAGLLSFLAIFGIVAYWITRGRINDWGFVNE